MGLEFGLNNKAVTKLTKKKGGRSRPSDRLLLFGFLVLF